MDALAKEDVVRKFAFTGESLDFGCMRIEPGLAFLWQYVERSGMLVIADELKAEPLEGQKNCGKRAGHHGAFFVGPVQFKGMSAKFFEDALGIAGDAESLNSFVGLEKFGSAKNLSGFTGPGHEDDLLGADATKRLFRSEEELGSGNSGGGDVTVLGPERGN